MLYDKFEEPFFLIQFGYFLVGIIAETRKEMEYLKAYFKLKLGSCDVWICTSYTEAYDMATEKGIYVIEDRSKEDRFLSSIHKCKREIVDLFLGLETADKGDLIKLFNETCSLPMQFFREKNYILQKIVEKLLYKN